MTDALCSRCLRSFEEAKLFAVNEELLCPECQALAEGRERRPPAGEKPPEVEEPRGVLRKLYGAVDEWCQGRWWWARLPLVLLFLWIFGNHLRDIFDPPAPELSYCSIFKGINLGIHEWGHYVFKPFGTFMEAAGGTILQCLAPLLATLTFFRQRDYFAIAVCFGWLSTNFFDVAVYAADARAQALPLVTPGGGPASHDWHYLLRTTGLLLHDAEVGAAFRIAGTAAMLLFLVPATWMLWRMWKTRSQPTVKQARREAGAE